MAADEGNPGQKSADETPRREKKEEANRFTHDNSTENNWNPDPTAEVDWGKQTLQEMQYSGLCILVDEQHQRPSVAAPTPVENFRGDRGRGLGSSDRGGTDCAQPLCAVARFIQKPYTASQLCEAIASVRVCPPQAAQISDNRSPNLDGRFTNHRGRLFQRSQPTTYQLDARDVDE